MNARSWVTFFLFCCIWLFQTVTAAQECERLKTTLQYTQADAPRDLSRAFSLVTDQVNKELDGVVDVDVEWSGSDFHGKVGEHIIVCKVTRLAKVIPPEDRQDREIYQDDRGREVATQCFHVPFTIYDTNECTLPLGHEMRHQCQEPAICVNTQGSYECLCPRIDGSLPAGFAVTEDRSSHTAAIDVAGDNEWNFFDAILQEQRNDWELSLGGASGTSCQAKASTRSCCSSMAHANDGMNCRAQFKCPLDPCVSDTHNECADNAQCHRAGSPREFPNYKCICPEGLLGNGKACQKHDEIPVPKTTHDGLPTEETIKANYCGCTKPIVDACSGFDKCTQKHEVCIVTASNTPICGCKKGFIKHDVYGCVDESPPKLKLKEDSHNDKTLRLKQGDHYEEHGVEILDDNAEDYLRTLKISYSEPLPRGCLDSVGEFYVNYTISTPWTEPPFVSVARRVVIENIDECSLNPADYENTCPQLIPRCDTAAGATCVDAVGSYSCQCPKYTTGDGFLKDTNFPEGFEPEGFQGGSSCVDTSKPIIELKGPNPKKFKICPCGGISGIMQDRDPDKDLREGQRAHYENDIQQLIQSTQGAELCATHDNNRPRPTDCIYAYDETYKGRVDLSARVAVGVPKRQSALHWTVPYDVKDDAGNVATTVYRDVLVEEVELDLMESEIRKEMMKSRDLEVQNAVQAAVAKALQEERKKKDSNTKVNARRGMTASSCPPCPKCSDGQVNTPAGSGKDAFDESHCDQICADRAHECLLQSRSIIVPFLVRFEDIMPIDVALFLIAVSLGMGCFYSTMICLGLCKQFAEKYNYSDYYATEMERERMMQNAITHYRGNTPEPNSQTNNQLMFTSPNQQQQFGGSNMGAMGMPPRSSMSTGRSDFFNSPPGSGGRNMSMNSAPFLNGNSPANGVNDPNSMYTSPPASIIQPMSTPRGGTELRRRNNALFST